MIQFIVLILLAYLMGSICSAVIVSKLCSLPDPRQEGSKNPGATNVLRLAGKQYAAIVMLADVLKGLIPVLIARLVSNDPITVGFTALAAVLGHMYPIFFEFKGGKGVATAIGALLGFQFILGIVVIATWLLIAKFLRYSSLASIVSITLAPIYSVFIIGSPNAVPPLLLITLFILYQHRNNITRLMDGTEPHIQFKRPMLEEIIEPETSSKRPIQHKATSPQVVEEKPKAKAPAKKTTATKKPSASKSTVKKPKATQAKPKKAKE
jgi:acyl phosphate:glycerol-3-phosphate acyltransferase